MHVKTFVVRCEGLVVYADLQATTKGLQVRVSSLASGGKDRAGRERPVGVLQFAVETPTTPAFLASHVDLPAAAHAALQREILEALG